MGEQDVLLAPPIILLGEQLLLLLSLFPRLGGGGKNGVLGGIRHLTTSWGGKITVRPGRR